MVNALISMDEKTLNKPFGDFIRDNREAKGWTRTEFADQMTSHGYPLNLSQVRRLEYGEVVARHLGNPAFVTALSAVFRVTRRDILRRSNLIKERTDPTGYNYLIESIEALDEADYPALETFIDFLKAKKPKSE